MLLTVLGNRALSPDIRLLDLAWPAGAAAPLPGQFVMVRTREGGDPPWRRPFGVHDFRRRGGRAVLSLLYQVVGVTTREMAAIPRGGALDLLGPHGRGFRVDAREHWLVAGGRGSAPLFYLARELRRRRLPCRAFLGGRGAAHVVRDDDLERLGCGVEVATDDGSRGRRGFVTELLERELARIPDEARGRILVSACGPEGMLRAAVRVCREAGAHLQVSVDPLMACGQGLCLGCTVPGSDGNRLACQHGPVFDAEALAW